MTTNTHANSAKTTWMQTGMKVMSVMMGFCLAATVMGATANLVGVTTAAGLAVFAGIAFAVVSLRYQQTMAAMMGLCCGAGVFVAAAPGMGVVGAVLLAVAVGGLIGIGSHRLMGTAHAHGG